MITEFTKLVLDFSRDTVRGIEAGLFEQRPELIKHSNIKNIQKGFCVHYYNKAYKSLILDNDEYIKLKYDEMNKILNHSYVCLLNVTFYVTLGIIENINRNNLNTTSA
jgi:hypothetical protein